MAAIKLLVVVPSLFSVKVPWLLLDAPVRISVGVSNYFPVAYGTALVYTGHNF
jgi:hypothetical protein